MKKADLHIHTDSSDGVFKVENIVKYACENNYSKIAITDHDNMNSCDKAEKLAENTSIKVIRGIEFTVDAYKDEVHILGYFKNNPDKKFFEQLNKINSLRVKRNKEIIKKMNEDNINITHEDVMKTINRDFYAGRAHIIMALINNEIIKDFEEGYNRFVNVGTKYYPEVWEELFYKNIIRFIHENNGISILAHPGFVKDELINKIISAGIDGLEAFHSSHNLDKQKKFREICKEKELFITGGSDFHGKGKTDIYLANLDESQLFINL